MIVTVRNDELVEALRTDFINCWIPIAQVTLAAPAASVAFASIPQNFRTLALIYLGRTDAVATNDNINWRANADAGASYDYVRLTGNNTATSSALTAAATSARCGMLDAANSRASCFGTGVVFWPGYALATMEKSSITTATFSEGTPTAATTFINLYGSHWRNTAAITSLTFIPTTGPNFVAGSVFALYGIL